MKCRRKRVLIRFTVAYFPPTEPIIAPGVVAHAASGPYDENKRCIDTSDGGSPIPPADPSWEIHVLSGVPPALGRSLQQAMIAHRVSSILHDGLGSNPLGYPRRIPIFLTPQNFNPAGSYRGLTAPTCANAGLDAIVVRTNQPTEEVQLVIAHELFHAFAYFGLNGGAGPDPWWEEASATWSPGRATRAWETAEYDVDLQYPNVALDTTDPSYPTYRYAMSRFVQFLDARGLIGGSSWPLQREVIGGYKSIGATAALSGALANRGTSLGEQLAAFWGDRLRAKPLHGPQLKPNGENAGQIKVDAGTSVVPVLAHSLHTKLLDFTIAGNVQRLEFQFDPPANGYFWGGVNADESRQFGFPVDDTVSFCVGGADQDDLAWPGHFPVTFTNGSLALGQIRGMITIRAYRDASQCTNPAVNRACALLQQGGVEPIIGQPGDFRPEFEGPIQHGFSWLCSYATSPTTKPRGAASLGVVRLKFPTKQVRTMARKLIAKSGFRPIKIGDVAGIGKVPGLGTRNIGVTMAVGKEIDVLVVSPRIQEHGAILLARRIAAQEGV